MLLTGWVVSIDTLLRNLLCIFVSRIYLWNPSANLKRNKPVRPADYQFHLLAAHQNWENIYIFFYKTHITHSIYGFFIIFTRDCSRYYEVTARHLSSYFCGIWHPYSTLTHKQIYRGRSDFILESASCAVVLSCGRPYIRPEHKPTSSTVKNAEYNFWMPKKYFPTSQCGFEEGVFSGCVEVEDIYPAPPLH
jgi:hypothetical protein